MVFGVLLARISVLGPSEGTTVHVSQGGLPSILNIVGPGLSTRKTSGEGLAKTLAGLNAFEISNIQGQETESH